MKIVWSPTAIADLIAIRNFIAEQGGLAVPVVAGIVDAVERLVDFPASGRPGRVPHTRELVVTGTPYIVPYTIANKELRVLAVLHAARKWPDGFA
jgi:toxin ParE1/3/4